MRKKEDRRTSAEAEGIGEEKRRRAAADRGEGDGELMPQNRIPAVLDALRTAYPEAGCALSYDNPFHLLVAVMLSAQTTDVSVNKVTPQLFDRYPDAAALAAADKRAVEDVIHTIGLYRTKSRHIIGMARQLEEKYRGEVPGSFDALCSLPGVGRKTANVVLAEAFGEQRIAVDTHVFRVANRLGLVRAATPEQTEQMLMARLPKARWTEAHHELIFHGRRCCRARRPNCASCPLREDCCHPEEKNRERND